MKNTSIDSYFESSHGKLNEINNFNLWEQLSAYVFILTRILLRLFHIQLKAEACNFIKNRESGTGEFCKISKNTFSYRTSPVVASEATI